MTKETILKRLLLENHITVEELVVLVETPGKTFTIDCSVTPKENWSDFLNNYWGYSFKTTPYHQSPNIVSSKL